jgi:hypothetical protein
LKGIHAMKQHNTKTFFPSALAAFLASVLPAAAEPVGNAFTYQGRLDHNGAPANGSFDLKFQLYNVAVDGMPVDPEGIELPAQNIAGGLFTADLDFGGPPVFDGTAYWLQMLARPAGAADYETVPGRTPVRAAPYAIHAFSAASVKDGAITGNSLADGAVTGTKLAPAAVGLAQLDLAAPPNPGQVLSSDGVGLTWIDAGGGGGAGAGPSPWILSGASPFMSWHDTASGRSATISSANGTLYYRVPNADDSLILTAGYVDANGMVTRGRLSVEGNDPFITWDDLGVRASISSASGTLYYRVPNPAGATVTAGYVDSNGMVTRGRLSVEGDDPFITWDDQGVRATISSASGTLYYRVPNPGGAVVTAGFVDYQGVVSNGRVFAQGDVTATRLVLRADPAAPTNAAVLCGDAGVTNFVPYNTATGRPLNIVVSDVGASNLTARDASVRALTIRGGADLAEPFAMSHSGVKPGSVVVIDEENPGKLKASTHAYDKKVAGIVSGANGIRPGISMIQEDKLEAGENVALSGRVYVRADTSAGNIEPGDLLTTSSTAGQAMKAADHDQAQGAIIGKAMTRLDDGDGMVLVLVTLQ